MAGEGETSVGVGGEESGASSPKNKVKFLCSHGGKVLPRPSDGLLKYVGGETRVISVPRTVTFSELMKKLGAMIEGGNSMVLKYQLVPEDLDTLVSVRNDEDIKHMIEEHDRHESGGAPLLRAFLFPSNLQAVAAAAVAAAATEPYALEQRYIDAINGIMRTSPRASWLSPIRAFCTSSTCSSPKSNSPDGHTASSDLVLPESSSSSLFHAPPPSRHPMMHRVRSSPSISSLGNLHGLTTTTTNTIQQQYDHHSHNHNHNHGHSHYQNQNQSHQHLPPPSSLAGYATPSRTLLPPDPQLGGGGGGFGMGRPQPMMALGKTDMSSSNNNNNSNSRGGNNNYYYSTSNRAPKGYAYYDDSAGYGGNVVMAERVSSMPHSPRKSIWE